MWLYEQLNGQLRPNAGAVAAVGYAGAVAGNGKNNPAMQHVRGVGSLPCGLYRIQPPIDHATLGPYALFLDPDKHNEMYGRGDFWAHGRSRRRPLDSSKGCIILDRPQRELIWTSGDTALVVIPCLMMIR